MFKRNIKWTRNELIIDLDFYVAYNMFRLAGILQSIVGRVRNGTASNAHAVAMEDRVKPLADMGWQYTFKAWVIGRTISRYCAFHCPLLEIIQKMIDDSQKER